MGPFHGEKGPVITAGERGRDEDRRDRNSASAFAAASLIIWQPVSTAFIACRGCSPRAAQMTEMTRFPIVGVGASAGGIPAMEALFKNLPATPGMAFVVVTHLSPERESLLHEVVERYTEMAVVIADDAMKVEPDHIYVMPQNAVLTIKDSVLALHRPQPPNRERKPIDMFFSALADNQHDYAVGIILSGGDGDGTLGAKAIKENGGLVLAQSADGSGPRNPDMPQSAIASGVVDIAVAAEEMGDRLVAFASGSGVLEPLADDDDDKSRSEDVDRAAIYAILHSHTGHDFPAIRRRPFCAGSDGACRSDSSNHCRAISSSSGQATSG
ncbi:chemotaxis protein CheB [Bosea sp. RCC_152_1]|uniref:chemotaxis protein CheB n=1 Tax=Bosea sp. RCC_152_1 TaxID=3239228 RepID=UPI00352543C2